MLSNLDSMENVILLSKFRKTNVLNKQTNQTKQEPTPIIDKLEVGSKELNQKSSYISNFDYHGLRLLEQRAINNPIRGGFLMNTLFRLVNAHPACQQCLYAFEIDSYGRGCSHNCVYCYAKAELTVHGYWNNPIPVPVNINKVRQIFYTCFETSKKHRLRSILEKKIPLRIGGMSDSFMWLDRVYGVTRELLKILNHYKYPFIVATRSDLVAEEEYLELLDPNLAVIQMSIATLNHEYSRRLEPGAPSPLRRLTALKKLNTAGIHTVVRINPFFPIYPDGFYSKEKKLEDLKLPPLAISTFDMIDSFSEHGIKAVVVGFGRFSGYSMNRISEALELDFRKYFDRCEIVKSKRDYHFSDDEIRCYYEIIRNKCKEKGILFTTCYIGNGDSFFWRDQDLWDNKKDCCNAKTKVPSFSNNSRQIPFEIRNNIFGNKDLKPISENIYSPLG